MTNSPMSITIKAKCSQHGSLPIRWQSTTTVHTMPPRCALTILRNALRSWIWCATCHQRCSLRTYKRVLQSHADARADSVHSANCNVSIATLIVLSVDDVNRAIGRSIATPYDFAHVSSQEASDCTTLLPGFEHRQLGFPGAFESPYSLAHPLSSILEIFCTFI